MSIERIEALKVRHAELDQALHTEEIRPMPNEIRISELKKEKLRVKDEIARLGIH